MAEKSIEFVERYRDWPFSRWKGGRYNIKLHDNEVDFFCWIFDNKLEKEVKFVKLKNQWIDSHNAYNMYFKTGETFMGFKLQWL